jgi:hypothetical protein
MNEMFLNDEEVSSLTQRVQRAAQARVLRSMGIEHRARPDGSLAVLRAHVEQSFGIGSAPKRARPPTEPNWGALNAARA